MSIQFGSPTPTGAAAQPQETSMEVVPYNIQEDRALMTQQLVGTKEVDDIVSTIEVYNLETIVGFGGEVADEIAKCSDAVLNGMNMRQIDDSGAMLTALGKIMDKFDIEEIREEPGFFGRLFSNMRRQLDKILDKYRTMGDEVDKIFVQLKQYESEIKESNRKLEQMFQANVGYYHELVKYILAGEQGCQEIANYIDQRRAALEQTGDQSIQFELQTLEQAQMMLEQRTQDLRIAENVAMQSIPHDQDHGIHQHEPGAQDQLGLHHHAAGLQAGPGPGHPAQAPAHPGRGHERPGRKDQ